HEQMTAARAEQRKVALVIHLPQVVGRAALKAGPLDLPRGQRGIQQIGAAQDAGDGTRCERGTALVEQLARQLAPVPTAARPQAQPNHRVFDLRGGASRTAPRTTRAILQRTGALLSIALQPLVA